MAQPYENIQIKYTNFCLGPQAGTFCTVDISAATALLHVKNSSGTLIDSFDFYPSGVLNVAADYGSDPHNEVTSVKYIGPNEQSGYFNNMLFFTFERQFDSLGTIEGFIIRKWLLNADLSRLELEASYTKITDATNYFDCYDLAVENTITALDTSAAIEDGQLTLPATVVSGIAVGNDLIIGPSLDADNLNAIEHCYVFSIDSSTVVSIRRIGPDRPPSNEYNAGDAVTILKDIYTFSSASTTASGALYKLDGSDYYNVIDKHESNIYDGIIAADWNSTYYGPSFIKGSEMLTVQLGDYEVIKSHNLKNITASKVLLPVYGLSLYGNTVYRLQRAVIKWADNGAEAVTNWSTYYNYVSDTLIPYTASINITKIADSMILKRLSQIDIDIKVRDQFGVSLSGKNITFEKSGDPGASFTGDNPTTTDVNGMASITYDAGTTYQGDVTLSVRVDGANTYLGSEYVWVIIKIPSIVEIDSAPELITQVIPPSDTYYLKQYLLGAEQYLLEQKEKVISYWYFEQAKIPYLNAIGGLGAVVPSNIQLRQLYEYLNDSYSTSGYDKTVWDAIGPPEVPEIVVTQKTTPVDTGTIDQTYVSRHLSTAHIDTTILDQFVFISEARPPFWSYKNSTDTDLWLRLRPFATSLDPNTLVIKIREVSYAGDTGWIDITSEGAITLFDAGGGLDGLEFLWYDTPPFHNNGLVYVNVEVYDTSPIPNKVIVDYWFKVIPDFKAPYLLNLYPAIEAFNIPVDTVISFGIHDDGAGVDMDSLEMLVNYAGVVPDIVKISDNQYNILYTPPIPFDYGDTVSVEISITDISDNDNILYDSWRFYTNTSSEPWIDTDNFYPGRCIKGLPRNHRGINFQVYGIADGVEEDSIEVYIGGPRRDVTITPIVYRLS